MRWPGLLSTVLVLAAGCSGLWADISAAEIANGLMATPDYRGRYVERGMLPGRPQAELVRDIVFAQPGKLRIETVAPKDRAGDLYVYDGQTATWWWPAEQTGLRVHGIAPPDEASLRSHIRGLVEQALSEFAWTSPGQEKVLERPTTVWKALPIAAGAGHLGHTEWRDNAYEWPLRLEVVNADGSPFYSFRFTRLALPSPGIAAAEFAFEFPGNAMVLEWNLGDPPLTLEQARAAMNFTVREMKRLPPGRTVQAHVKARGTVPMLLSRADGGGAWLSLSQHRYAGRGEYALPVGREIAIGKRRGYANFAAGSTWISWVQDGTELTLAGNLSWPDMLDVAQGVK